MVFYKLPSTQPIVQRGYAASIHGTSNVGSTIINISDLRPAPVCQQPDPDSVVSIRFMMITERLMWNPTNEYERGLDVDVTLRRRWAEWQLLSRPECMSEISMGEILRRMTDAATRGVDGVE